MVEHSIIFNFQIKIQKMRTFKGSYNFSPDVELLQLLLRNFCLLEVRMKNKEKHDQGTKNLSFFVFEKFSESKQSC